jgi:hypothetical protein
MIREPPSVVGDHVIVIDCAVYEVPVMKGGPGTVLGVTITELDAGPLPLPLVARTVHAYCVPLLRPITVTVNVVLSTEAE